MDATNDGRFLQCPAFTDSGDLQLTLDVRSANGNCTQTLRERQLLCNRRMLPEQQRKPSPG
jgi:hypothetical protein